MSRVCVRELSWEKGAVIIKLLKTVLAPGPDQILNELDRSEQ